MDFNLIPYTTSRTHRLRLFSLVFCINPGPLSNGRIFVTLKDERASSMPIRNEFRSYIPNVGHGRTIEFECYPGLIAISFLVSVNVFSLFFRLYSARSIRIDLQSWPMDASGKTTLHDR